MGGLIDCCGRIDVSTSWRCQIDLVAIIGKGSQSIHGIRGRDSDGVSDIRWKKAEILGTHILPHLTIPSRSPAGFLAKQAGYVAKDTAVVNRHFASGYGIGYSLAVVIPSFYSFYLLGLSAFMPYAYTPLVLMFAAGVLAVIGAWLGPETRDVDLAAASGTSAVQVGQASLLEP